MAFDTTKFVMAYPNRIDQATFVTAGSWSSTFPRTNLQNTTVGDVKGMIRSIKARSNSVLGTGEAMTNLFLQSQAADNASWTKTACTVTANATLAPDGTTTADTVKPDATTVSNHQISQSITVANNARYAVSVYAKANGFGFLSIIFPAAGFGTNDIVTFNLSTGAVTYNSNAPTGNGAFGVATSAANGFYRCVAYKDSSVAGSANINLRVSSTSADPSYAGNAVLGVDVWGMQCEVDGVSTYYPTTTTTATRQNDATLRWQMDTLRSVSVIAVIAHNLSSVATWRVRLFSDNASNNVSYDSGLMNVWPSSGWSPEATEWEDNNFWPGLLYSDPTNNLQKTCICFADRAYTSVRSVIVDFVDALNPDLYVELGRVFCSDVKQPTFNPNYGVQYGVSTSTVVDEALDSSEYFDTRKLRRTAQFVLENMADTDSKYAAAAGANVGIHKEILISNDMDTTHVLFPFKAFVGRNKDLTPLENPYFARHKASFNIQEIV